MSESITVTLPLPPEPLYPNKRIRNCYGISRLVASTRAAAKLLVGLELPSDWTPPAAVKIAATFHMPRKRDADNLLAWAKHHFDGAAEAIGINDACFQHEMPKQVTGKAAGGERKLILEIRRLA